jgi:hypothetical protein
MAQQTEHRGFASPDGAGDVPNAKAEILKVGDCELGGLVLQPGRRSSDVDCAK